MNIISITIRSWNIVGQPHSLSQGSTNRVLTIFSCYNLDYIPNFHSEDIGFWILRRPQIHGEKTCQSTRSLSLKEMTVCLEINLSFGHSFDNLISTRKSCYSKHSGSLRGGIPRRRGNRQLPAGSFMFRRDSCHNLYL